MKNFKKGFTLVEMLIVVVIIGILAAALLPRLQSAQASARDSARVSSLQQIATAIAGYVNERGEYPTKDGAPTTKSWPTTDLIKPLSDGGFVTTLPNESKKDMSIAAINGLDENNTKGSFAYVFLKKGGREKGAIALVAAMERPGNANYVYKENENSIGTDNTSDAVEKIYLCETITKVANESDVVTAKATDKNCKYSTESQLYYVAIY